MRPHAFANWKHQTPLRSTNQMAVSKRESADAIQVPPLQLPYDFQQSLLSQQEMTNHHRHEIWKMMYLQKSQVRPFKQRYRKPNPFVAGSKEAQIKKLNHLIQSQVAPNAPSNDDSTTQMTFGTFAQNKGSVPTHFYNKPLSLFQGPSRLESETASNLTFYNLVDNKRTDVRSCNID